MGSTQEGWSQQIKVYRIKIKTAKHLLFYFKNSRVHNLFVHIFV